MKNIFNVLRVKSETNQLLDLVLSMIEKQDLSHIKKIADGRYTVGDATVSIKYFDKDAFEEMQISFGYAIGKGFTLVLRNYIEHLVVINHEILETYQTIEFPVRPDSLLVKDYREKLDAVAINIINAVEALEDAK